MGYPTDNNDNRPAPVHEVSYSYTVM